MNLRHAVLSAGLALLVTPLAHAGSASDRAADRAEIVAGERAWGHAYVTGDVATVRRLLADDFRGVDPHGAIYDKASVLKDVRDGPHSTSDEVGPITLRLHGDTAVAQAHEHEVGPPPARKSAEHVFTDTWVELHGQWRIVAAEDVEAAPAK